MRFLLTLCIWIVIVGGLWTYTERKPIPVATAQTSYVDLSVEGSFACELTPTFHLEEDPFALQIEEDAGPDIELKINGNGVALPGMPVRRGEVIRVDEVEGILEGQNEIYVRASPPLSEGSLEQGMRIKVLSGEEVIAEHTVWNSGGALVSGGFSFVYRPGEEGGHDH